MPGSPGQEDWARQQQGSSAQPPPWPAQHAPSSSFQLKPSRQAYSRYLMSALPVAGIIVVISVVRMAARWDDPINRWGALVLAVVAVGAALAVWDYLRHASVTLTPTELIQVGFFRRRRSTPRADLGLSVLVPALASTSFRGPAANLFVLRRDGSKVLRLNEGFYPTDDLVALSQALGLPVDTLSGVTAPKTLRERYPSTATWAEAHPFGLAAIIVGVVIVLVVVIAAVAVALGAD